MPGDDHQEQQQQLSRPRRGLEDMPCVQQRAEPEKRLLRGSPEAHEQIPKNWTVSYLYCWSLVSLGSDCDGAPVLPS